MKHQHHFFGRANTLLQNILLFCMMLLPATMLAQIPQAVNYQAIVRDGDGNPISEETVSVRLSIHSESATGPVVYSESHAVTTTAGGLINLAIGQGTIISGEMSNVNWLEYPKYLQVDLDEAGGSNYIEMGTSQLISVPYSFASNVSESLSPGATVDLYQLLPGGAEGGQFLMWNGANWVPATMTSEGVYAAGAGIELNGNTIVNTGDLSNTNELQSLSINGNILSLSNGGSVTLPDNGGTTYEAGNGIAIVGNTISATDVSATNELQTISLNGNVLTLTDGGSVTLPSGGGGSYVAGNGININGNTISALDNSATNEMQTLSVNGNTLSILGGNTVNLPSGNTYTAGEGVYLNGTEISAVDVSDVNEIQFLNIADNTITLSGGGGAVSIPNAWVSVPGNNIVNPNGGNVGIDPIGFAVPTATLDVQRGNALDGTAAFRGTNHISHFNYGTSEDTYLRGGKNGSALYFNDTHNGNVNVATGGGGLGIGINANLSYKAQLASNFGKGMRIEVTGTNPASPEGLAVDNQSASGIDKYGIYSQSIGLGLGSNWGVVGKAFGGSSGYKVGVFGEANGTGLSNTSTGVMGRAISENGMDNFGVFGEASAITAGFNFGVFGTSSGNTLFYPTGADPELDQMQCAFCNNNHNGGFGIYGLGNYEFTTETSSWAGFFDGDVYAYNLYYNTSDASLKRNITSLNNSIDVVKRLRPVSYNMRTSVDINAPYSNQLSFGFIAQEMAEVLPELVTTFIHPGDVKKAGDEQNLMAISYDGLIPVLTSCIQEQQQKIEELEQQIVLMQQNMDVFNAFMEELKSKQDGE